MTAPTPKMPTLPPRMTFSKSEDAAATFAEAMAILGARFKVEVKLVTAWGAPRWRVSIRDGIAGEVSGEASALDAAAVRLLEKVDAMDSEDGDLSEALESSIRLVKVGR